MFYSASGEAPLEVGDALSFVDATDHVSVGRINKCEPNRILGMSNPYGFVDIAQISYYRWLTIMNSQRNLKYPTLGDELFAASPPFGNSVLEPSMFQVSMVHNDDL